MIACCILDQSQITKKSTHSIVLKARPSILDLGIVAHLCHASYCDESPKGTLKRIQCALINFRS
jgi:hypothetical protein